MALTVDGPFVNARIHCDVPDCKVSRQYWLQGQWDDTKPDGVDIYDPEYFFREMLPSDHWLVVQPPASDPRNLEFVCPTHNPLVKTEEVT